MDIGVSSSPLGTPLGESMAREITPARARKRGIKLLFAKKLLSAILWLEKLGDLETKSKRVADMETEFTNNGGGNASNNKGKGKGFFYPLRVFVLGLTGFALTSLAAFILLINLHGGREQNLLFIADPRGGWHLAQELEKAEIISSAVLFRAAIALYAGKALKSGEYHINKDDSYTDIIAKLVKGKYARFHFTIPEGRSHHDIKEALRINTILRGEIGKTPEEGTLLPETYFIHRGKYRQHVVRRMHSIHQRLVKKLWNKRAKDLPLKTAREAVILASIVEKETGIQGEREKIAGVFINRLDKKSYMQLQSDPTVIYALTGGKPFGRTLTYTDLRVDNPYNSYKNYGLPPGAIANPGRAALEAVMNPAKTKHFYFVADGTGGHVFAETYEQHLENVKKWREIQNGEKNEEKKDSTIADNKEESIAKN